jgi:hypothetical protein
MRIQCPKGLAEVGARVVAGPGRPRLRPPSIHYEINIIILIILIYSLIHFEVVPFKVQIRCTFLFLGTHFMSSLSRLSRIRWPFEVGSFELRFSRFSRSVLGRSRFSL